MITQLKFDKVDQWQRPLLAVSLVGMLLMPPTASAEQMASGAAPAQQGTGSYGAVPPPPGPYGGVPA